ncbi:creatininase family protein [Mesorhizobium sp. BAC0120]|uniref:creatininase family protein n=1 Tax=Mesorhizobium sp. BAC0120 TaxID=3090670 RepID=UPI00298D1F60|nr:creatininase family protein [Mesorhizobium sp. BAC0120]MDW6021626.1 creatininase family protein [Mesorhizobium sp. BAC0120]
MATSRFWYELTSDEAAALPDNCVAVLPVAAIEQHGTHLPLGTDTFINRGILERTRGMLCETVPVVILPEQTVGASQEHSDYAGSLYHPAHKLMGQWTRVLEGAVRSGLKRLLVFNSHGGQTGLLAPVCLDLRVRYDVVAAYATWFDAGYPDGLFDEVEMCYAMHGGAVETSLMLHLRPDLVRMGKAVRAPYGAASIESATQQLSANPKEGRLGGLGWKSQDISMHGVDGDAASATAEKGRLLLDHIASRLADLLRDLAGGGLPLVKHPHPAFSPAER